MPPVADEFPSDVPDQPELVSLRREGPLAWITIERPEVANCLSFPTLRRFRILLEELAGDLSIRCLLIGGRGEKAFCAGADLKERRTMPAERVPMFVRNIRGLMDDVEAMPQPIIHRVVPRPLDVEGATRRIREMIQGRELLDFREIVGPHPHVSDIISALVAILEMARLGEITLTQQRPLTSFTVHSGPADPTD